MRIRVGHDGSTNNSTLGEEAWRSATEGVGSGREGFGSPPQTYPISSAASSPEMGEEEILNISQDVDDVLSVIPNRKNIDEKPNTVQIYFDEKRIDRIVFHVDRHDFQREGSTRLAIFDSSDLPIIPHFDKNHFLTSQVCGQSRRQVRLYPHRRGDVGRHRTIAAGNGSGAERAQGAIAGCHEDEHGTEFRGRGPHAHEDVHQEEFPRSGGQLFSAFCWGCCIFRTVQQLSKSDHRSSFVVRGWQWVNRI